MSRRYELSSTVTVDGSEEDLRVLRSVLEDEETRVGRARFRVSSDERIVIDVEAPDAVALKTAISALSGIIRSTEKMNTIGEK